VLNSEVVLPVVGERLVERAILLRGNVLGVAGPERLGVVELDLLSDVLLDGLKGETTVSMKRGNSMRASGKRTLVFFSFFESSSSTSSILGLSSSVFSSSSSSTSFSTSLVVTSWMG
jgi:hypothetical protein